MVQLENDYIVASGPPINCIELLSNCVTSDINHKIASLRQNLFNHCPKIVKLFVNIILILILILIPILFSYKVPGGTMLTKKKLRNSKQHL